ncbi:MAG: hypothetical protein GY737_25010 [Desulfobacteraceae bacterium]|nr:hypothetical protein [Desulfobacteraceae bacterium]
MLAHDGIIYGIDGTIGKPGGLERVNSVFLMFGLALDQVATLDWSYDSGVAVFMHFKTSNINAHSTWRIDLTRFLSLKLPHTRVYLQ